MKKITIYILAIFFISSCTEPIELDLNKGDNLKLVVNALIDNSSRSQYVELSLTSDYYDESSGGIVNDADVTVSDNTTNYALQHQSNGRYLLPENFRGKIGHNYTLTISYKNEIYTASHYMDTVAQFDDAYATYFLKEEDDSLTIYDFFIDVQEPEGKGDYYLFNTYKKGSIPFLDISYVGYYSDEFYDGNYIEDTYVTEGRYNPGDEAILQMYSLSQEAHDYLLAITDQTEYRGGLFDTPPANVPTNIKGGGFGFFITAAVAEIDVEIPE